ncbi:hypothetical protein PsorP6_017711 [Peronosclerospora sorghi]|uniref:Uncharacterized protein n=1 Tax=Peronosclerospora sorghi TaxID=230839 RepID=A0ACC0WNK0_9STRA|nr:hypothetical protein PsorP6_017711 [Peronosclerospora sorghi]
MSLSAVQTRHGAIFFLTSVLLRTCKTVVTGFTWVASSLHGHTHHSRQHYLPLQLLPKPELPGKATIRRLATEVRLPQHGAPPRASRAKLTVDATTRHICWKECDGTRGRSSCDVPRDKISGKPRALRFTIVMITLAPQSAGNQASSYDLPSYPSSFMGAFLASQLILGRLLSQHDDAVDYHPDCTWKRHARDVLSVVVDPKTILWFHNKAFLGYGHNSKSVVVKTESLKYSRRECGIYFAKASRSLQRPGASNVVLLLRTK